MLQCTRFLLFATKYPEGTKTKELNSLILVAAMDSACFHGAHFPRSPDDRNSINRVIQSFAPMFVGTIFNPKGHFSANASSVQGHVILNFSESFTVGPPATNSPLDVFTSTDLTESRGYFIVWLFMTGSESDMQDLKNTTVTFDPLTSAIPTVK